MIQEYVVADGKLFVKDDDKLLERKDMPCEEQLKLENEIEILENLLTDDQKEYDRFKNSKKPKHTIRWAIGITLTVFGLNVLFSFVAGDNLPLELAIKHLATFESLFFLAILSINYYDEKMHYRRKCGLQERIDYLESEIESKKCAKKVIEQKKIQSLENTQIQSLENFNKTYTETEKARLDQIDFLGAYKEEIIKHYKEGTLKEFLLQHGIRESNIDSRAEFIEKRLSMKPIPTNPTTKK